MRSLVVLGLAVALLWTTLTAEAQPPTIPKSGIQGYVRSTDGSALSQVEVTVFQNGTAGPHVRMNNDEGLYHFWLIEGDYEVCAEAPGYVSSARAPVHVPRDAWAWQNFTLRPADSASSTDPPVSPGSIKHTCTGNGAPVYALPSLAGSLAILATALVLRAARRARHSDAHD